MSKHDPERRRDWLNIGRDYHEGSTERYGESRPRVEEAIAGLTWKPVPDDGEMQLPMSPGLMLKEIVKQLDLPKVTAVAHDGLLYWPDGPETAHLGVLGVECNYSDARVRVYVLDTGTTAIPLCSDVWPHASQASAGSVSS